MAAAPISILVGVGPGQLHRDSRRHRRRARAGDRLGRGARGHVLAGAARGRSAVGKARSRRRCSAATASCSCSSSTARRSSRRPSCATLPRPRPRSCIDCRARRRLRRRASWSRRAAGAKRARRWPSAANALRLPAALRNLAAQAGLCPRARRPRAGGRLMATGRAAMCASTAALRDDLDAVMAVMDAAFGDRFGEAWTRSQLRRDPADGRRVADRCARAGQRPARSAFRCRGPSPTNPSCCCLRLLPTHHRRGVGARAARRLPGTGTKRRSIARVHLEVRDGNPAVEMYRRRGFSRQSAAAATIIMRPTDDVSTRLRSPANFSLNSFKS